MPRSTLRRFLIVGGLAVLMGMPVSQPGPRAAPDEVPITAVIELFTSQGCSSCPPADALLGQYAKRPDVMALSLPVDYWDYIGWKDTFALPKNAVRQRSYVRAIGAQSVFTPQVIVNGTASAVGSSRSGVDHAIRSTKAAYAARRVPIFGSRNGKGYVVNIGSQRGQLASQRATVWLLSITRSAVVAIKRGENGGRTIRYTNIVRSMVPVGTWSGKPISIPVSMKAPTTDDTQRTAVLLQEGTDGPIIGAAWLDG